MEKMSSQIRISSKRDSKEQSEDYKVRIWRNPDSFLSFEEEQKSTHCLAVEKETTNPDKERALIFRKDLPPSKDQEKKREIPGGRGVYQSTLSKEILMSFELLKNFSIPEAKKVAKKAVDLPFLPHGCQKKTLVLDLDETLVFSSQKQLERAKTSSMSIHIKIRPYTYEFLERLSEHYEIILYTSGLKKYAEVVARQIDPERRIFCKVLSRKNCFKQKNYFVKDLRVLRGRKLSKIVVIDNTIISFAGYLDNLIYIPSYVGKKKDEELKIICDFLVEISNFPDVRPYVSNFAGIKALYDKYLFSA